MSNFDDAMWQMGFNEGYAGQPCDPDNNDPMYLAGHVQGEIASIWDAE